MFLDFAMEHESFFENKKDYQDNHVDNLSVLLTEDESSHEEEENKEFMLAEICEMKDEFSDCEFSDSEE